ncbi:hypothetical protein [Natrinema pallidum]|nr:hypothetical protein [Natrinema pallidum]
MTAVTIPHPREDAKTVVKAAFEDCSDIDTYFDDGIRITGKTGASLGLITSSYGEKVIIEVPENQASETETMVSVTGEKEVSANIGADPEKYISRVIKSINDIKGKDIDVIIEVLDENNVSENSKEVRNEADQAGGKGILILVMVLIMFFVFLMPLIII